MRNRPDRDGTGHRRYRPDGAALGHQRLHQLGGNGRQRALNAPFRPPGEPAYAAGGMPGSPAAAGRAGPVARRDGAVPAPWPTGTDLACLWPTGTERMRPGGPQGHNGGAGRPADQPPAGRRHRGHLGVQFL